MPEIKRFNSTTFAEIEEARQAASKLSDADSVSKDVIQDALNLYERLRRYGTEGL